MRPFQTKHRLVFQFCMYNMYAKFSLRTSKSDELHRKKSEISLIRQTTVETNAQKKTTHRKKQNEIKRHK